MLFVLDYLEALNCLRKIIGFFLTCIVMSVCKEAFMVRSRGSSGSVSKTMCPKITERKYIATGYFVINFIRSAEHDISIVSLLQA